MVLHGLANKAYNGKTGTVQGKRTDKNRWAVRMDDVIKELKQKKPETISVSPANIKRITPTIVDPPPKKKSKWAIGLLTGLVVGAGAVVLAPAAIVVTTGAAVAAGAAAGGAAGAVGVLVWEDIREVN